MREVKKYK